jgi:DNA-binding response OmpR family regulator
MTARESILVVEHEAAMAEMLHDHFVGQGYEVEVAMHGGDALMLAAQCRPAAVILEIRLPETSGPAVLSQLRALDDSLAVVLLSGTDDEDLARSLLKAGAFDYVRKPFDFDRLDHVVTLAVAVGQQKARHGVVLPFRSDRRAAAASPSDEAAVSRSWCGTCGQAITDEPRAVMDKGAVFHATCWLQRRMKGRQ